MSRRALVAIVLAAIGAAYAEETSDSYAAARARADAFAAACRNASFAPVVLLPESRYVVVRDFSRGVDALPPRGNPVVCALRRLLRRPATQRCARWEVGRYDERRRSMYTTELFDDAEYSIDGYAGVRDVHIGLDIGGPVGTPVFAPEDGFVHSFGYNAAAGDYGHVVVLESVVGDATVWMLFGHLDAATSAFKRQGQHVSRGERIGAMGAKHENGGWLPHLHFQLALVEPATHDMPGVVSVAQRERALADYPDPRLVAGDLYRDDSE